MNYQPTRQPRAHQVEALRRLRDHPEAFAILAEMGTGKSKMICDEFGERELAGDLQDLLIIAPAGSYRNWDRNQSEEQLAQFSHFSEDLQSRIEVGAWVSSAKAAEKRQLERLLAFRSGPRAMVVNVEALSSVRAAKTACVDFLRAEGRRAMLVVDESTVIKGRESIRTAQVLDLREMAAARRILTGLVTPNSPLDLYSQFEFLDWEILGSRSWHAFRARYAVIQKSQVFIPGAKGRSRTVETVVAYRREDELAARIAPHSYRVLKEDCLDLPPKVYMRRAVPLTKTQRRMYDELKKFSTAELQNSVHVTATQVMAKLLRLHQLVCGHVVDERGEVHDVDSNRIPELMTLLEEHAGKAIIWAAYHESIKQIVAAITAAYGEGSLAQWHGNVPTATRLADQSRFLQDPGCRFMIATPAAGGRGNTWVNASLVVYHANTYDLEQRMQSEDRCHRDGLKHSVTYVDLVAEGTVDERIIGALRKKINMASIITGENYRGWLI